MGRIIALPIETIVRELDAKVLLSVYLLQEGFEVLLGSRGSVWNELKFLRNADIIYKSISIDIKDNLFSVRENSGKVYILDEEANVFSKNQDDIIKSIFPEDMTEYIDHYFISGEKIKSLVLKNIAGINENQLHVVGHPRFDYFKKTYRDYYRSTTDKIKSRYGKFILFNLNFSLGNPYRGWNAQINYLDNHPDFNGSFISDMKNKMIWQKRNVQEFIRIIKQTADFYNTYNIIVRPHPSENENLYINEFKSFKNIFVEKEGNVLNWIPASMISVHYDCTTGIETVLYGKPSISYTPNRDEKLVNWLSPFVSDEVHTEEDFFRTLESYLNGQKKWTLSEEKSNVLNSYIANQTIDSAKEISKIIKTLTPTKHSYSINSIIRFFSRLRKRLGKFKRILFIKDEYTHHFRDLKKRDVKAGINKLIDILEFDFEIEVINHGIDTYLIRKSR